MIDHRPSNPKLMRLCRGNWHLGTFFGSPPNKSNRDHLPDVQDRIGSSLIPIRMSENQGRIDEPT